MPATTDTWTAADGSRFGREVWKSAARPRARVIALHGLGCRGADFAPLGETLQARGIELAAWDLRGQGLDPVVSRRGAWLDLEGVLADLANFTAQTGDLDVPVFLCGESMGALLALQAAITEPGRQKIAGLLLFSAVVGLAQKNPPWVKLLLRFIAALAPRLRLKPGWFVHGSGAMPPLTRISERQQYLATAPHRLGPLTLKFLITMGDLIEAAPAHAVQLTAPVAMFSAGHDVFVTPEQSREFFARIASADKTHFQYAESYHQLLFDLDAAPVLADATRWLEARVATNTSP